MQIRQLEYFIAVAEELHFGRAAIRLNMTQPPLSLQIQKLEDFLEVKLFNRSKHHVELTEVGKIFLVEAKKILNEIENSINIVKKASKGDVGELKIGYTSHSVYKILPNILQIYYKKFPLVDVKLQQLSTNEQTQALLNNKIQIGLLSPPVNNPDIILETIHREPLIIALPSNHPLALDTSPVSVKDLENNPFIITSRDKGTGFYDLIINIFREVDLKPNIIQEVNELHTAISLVSTGLGITIVPLSLEQHKKKNVIYKPLKDIDINLSTCIAWNNSKKNSLIENFLEVVKDNKMELINC